MLYNQLSRFSEKPVKLVLKIGGQDAASVGDPADQDPVPDIGGESSKKHKHKKKKKKHKHEKGDRERSSRKVGA